MLPARTSPSKWVTEPALDVGRSAASPMTKMLGRALDWSVCGSAGTNPELVAQSRRPVDVGSAAVQRDDDRQVEGDLALVKRDQPAAFAVDLAGVELRDELDPLVLQQTGELLAAAGFVNAPSSGVT